MAVVLNQQAYRIRTDATAAQGGTPVWLAAQNTNANPPINTPFRIRFAVADTGTTSSTTLASNIFVSKNGGAFAQVPSTSSGNAVFCTDATAGASANNSVITTSLLTGASGTFSGLGEYNDSGTTATHTITTVDYVEYEFGLQINGAVAYNGDNFQFRVYRSGSPLNTYTVTPTIVAMLPVSILPIWEFWRREYVPEPSWNAAPLAVAAVALIGAGYLATSTFQPPFYAPRPGPIDFWQGSPVQLSVISKLTAGGEPFAKQWRYDVVPQPDWRWTPPNGTLFALTAGGKPFAQQWRYDTFEPPSWAWSSGWVSDALSSLTAGGKPFTKQWRTDIVPQPDWVWEPPSGTIHQPAASQPFAKQWRYDLAEPLSWQWTPPNGTLNEPAPSTTVVVSAPFYAPRPGTIDSLWLGTPLAAVALDALSVNSPISSGPWLLPPTELTVWGWKPPAPISKPGAQPFSRLWRSDVTIDQAWQWASGWNADTLASLTAGGQPFAKQWRYDLVPDAFWQGAPTSEPVSNIPPPPTIVVSAPFYAPRPGPIDFWFWPPQAQPKVQNLPPPLEPFSQQWRYDVVPPPDWHWTPPVGVALDDLSVNAPISGGPWLLPPTEPTAWAWAPPNGTIAEPVTGEPFARLWIYNYAVEALWQGSPIKAPVIADFTAGGEPFAKQWRWDIVPQPDWAWTAPNVTLNEPVAATPFFRQWRYDVVPQPDWAWTPPNGTINEPFVGEPFFIPWLQWRYDFVAEPFWAGVPITAPVLADGAGPPIPPVPPSGGDTHDGGHHRRYTASQLAQVNGWLKARRDRRKEEEAKAAIAVAKTAIAAIDEVEASAPAATPRKPLPLSTKARRKLQEALRKSPVQAPRPIVALAMHTATVLEVKPPGPSFAERRAQLRADWEAVLAAHEDAIEREDEEIVHRFIQHLMGEDRLDG